MHALPASVGHADVEVLLTRKGEGTGADGMGGKVTIPRELEQRHYNR